MFNRQVALLNLICKEEITNVDGAGALTGTFLTIFEEQNGVFVVLTKDVPLLVVHLRDSYWGSYTVLISCLNQSDCFHLLVA